MKAARKKAETQYDNDIRTAYYTAVLSRVDKMPKLETLLIRHRELKPKLSPKERNKKLIADMKRYNDHLIKAGNVIAEASE
ncbi:hypothetical protein [Cereibacter sphaeroides]|jgi:hypothetical protein|nr:hypothetical protein [Cereibacter sphaeroides]